MSVQNQHEQRGENMIFGKLSWIADELVGIRTVEQRLSEEIQSPAGRDNDDLLSRINDLRGRVNNLDRAIDEYALRETRRAPARALVQRAAAGSSA